jgi:hypothetical protein
MEKPALKTAGVVFFVVAVLHVVRIAMKLPVIVGHTHIPLRSSAVAAVLMLALAVWMFKAAGCGCCKK